MVGLPKHIIKKYGVSKKAWSVYRRSSGKKRKSTTKKTRTRSRTMAKRKSYRRTASNVLGKLNKPMVGAIGVVLYERFLSPMIPLQGTAKDVAELVGGLYLSKKSGMLGAVGQSLVVLNSYQLINRTMGQLNLGGAAGTGQTNAGAIF